MLASSDTALRECYNHLQESDDASRPNEAAYAAYKAIEVLIDQFGSEEKNAVNVLGKIVKDAKRAANQKRHISKKAQTQQKTSLDPVGSTKQAIREYERYLLKRHGCI
jgi:hypothetical protein